MEAPTGDPYKVDEEIPVRTVISKRKVASAPAAPAYKGNIALLQCTLQENPHLVKTSYRAWLDKAS